MQESPARSVSFGYSQDYANQQLTNKNIMHLWKQSGDSRGWWV